MLNATVDSASPNKRSQRLELADVFRQHGHLLDALSPAQARVLNDIVACRTAQLGGHARKCDDCGHVEHSYNSCRNRHCPKCQSLKKVEWLERRMDDLLPVPYFHVVFTLSDVLNPLILRNQRVMYNILFRAASETLREVAANPVHLGAQIGFIAVLHTWSQTLLDHPHLHCVVPGGGLSADGGKWIACRKGFFLPVRILSVVFRGKFLDYTQQAFQKGELVFPGQIQPLSDPAEFQKLLKSSCKSKWVVYAKRPFAGPKQVLEYLGRYTHRVALSNNRLVEMKDDHVSFTWKNYRDGGGRQVMTLQTTEFMRRFLLHVLPKGFVRIRHYGFLGNPVHKEKLERCRKLMGLTPEQQSRSSARLSETWQQMMERLTGTDPACCPSCKKGRLIDCGTLLPCKPTIRFFARQGRSP